MGRFLARALIALAVAVATVLVPIGGLQQARAELTDLPDKTWGVVDRGRSITTATPSEVMAIAQIGNTIYAGGQFRTVVRRRAADPQFSQPFLAAFDATTGEWIDWWRPQFNGPIFALEASADGSRLYVGGEFTEVNGHPGTAGIVALDPASGRIDHTFTPNIESAFAADPAAVRTLKESEGWLYFGGSLSHATGNSSNTRTRLWKVGRLSTTDAAPDPNWRPVVKTGSVWGLDHDPVRDRVYLAGFFETVNNDSPTDKFAVVNDTDGDTILGLNRFPELTPTQDHHFEVIAHGDYVWVAGTQHLVHMLNASDLSINRRWFTGFESGFHIGGDYQALGIVGDAMFATCHCWGVIRELPNWVTTLSQADDIQPLTDEVQGIMGFDLATGDYVSSNWDPDILGQIGGWAVHGAPDGCMWAGGDFNRRAIGDQWRNGLVRWCDDAGQGPPAGPPLQEMPPPETNPPSIPGNVSASDNGDGTTTISWNASTDDTAVAYYRVYRDGFMVSATQGTSLTDVSPTPGDSYTVRAVDPYDNESGDSATATPNLAGLLDRAVNDSFDGNDGGYTYVDDVFNGTSEPDFADGKVRRDGGDPGGSMMVILAGVDNADFGGFSGAWEKTFNLGTAGDVQIDLEYKLEVKDSLESNEYGQAIAAVDGIRLNGGYLQQINGGGNSDWVSYSTTMTLGAGSHTLQLGGYQNYKTQSSEFTEVTFDNVSVTPLAPSVGFTSPDPGGEVTGVQTFELRASSLTDASSALDVDVSTDGGNNWSATSWNGAIERFEFSYDVSGEPDGPLTLQTRVTDTSARTGSSAETFIVNNDQDPTIAITNPTNGANVMDVVTVRVSADDNDPAGTLDVDVSTDGGGAWNAAAWNGSQYTYAWDTSVNGDGPATVRARVTDSGGSTVHATPVNVTVGAGVDYAATVLGDGAASYWRLGEAAGANAADSAGSLDGTYVGTPGLAAPALISSSDSAVEFDGVDDIVTLPDSTILNLGGPHSTKTFEAWFNADDVAGRQVIYEQGATSRGMNLYVRDGKVWAGAWNRTSNAGDPETPWASDLFISAPINPGVTYHVVSVFDYPSGTYSLYVNGALADSAATSGRLYAHGGDLGLGAMRGSSRFDNGGKGGGVDSQWFGGTIDEVATYNVPLSAGVVANHYLIGGPTLDYAATVAADGAGVHWRLGEASGTNAVDALGGNDAAYIGSPGLGTSGVIVDSDTAVSFDGNDDIVAIVDSSDVNLGGPYDTWSIELWFNADDVSNRGVLYEQGATSRGFNIYVMNGNLYAGAWNITDNGHPSQPWGPLFVSAPISTGTVYHAVLVFDYPGDSLELYLNGTLADSGSGVGQIFNHGGDAAIGAMNDTARFHDGGKGGGDNWFFDGVIDEVALYSGALSGPAIANHYTIGLL